MATTQFMLQIKGFGKQKMAAVSKRARELGMTPQRYVKHLVEEDLEISEGPRPRVSRSFLAPVSRRTRTRSTGWSRMPGRERIRRVRQSGPYECRQMRSSR